MSGWTKKRRLMQRYDLTASMYDLRYAEEQKAKIEAALKHAETTHFGLLLDAGCGTGNSFEYIFNRADTIVGLDLSKKTLFKAKAKTIEKNFTNIHLVQADADNMPFADRIFEHILAITLLQNAPNAEKMLKETKRVAKPNALIVMTGLKNIFSRQRFTDLLKKAELKTEGFENGELKCYVAVCRNSCS